MNFVGIFSFFNRGLFPYWCLPGGPTSSRGSGARSRLHSEGVDPSYHLSLAPKQARSRGEVSYSTTPVPRGKGTRFAATVERGADRVRTVLGLLGVEVLGEYLVPEPSPLSLRAICVQAEVAPSPPPPPLLWVIWAGCSPPPGQKHVHCIHVSRR